MFFDSIHLVKYYAKKKWFLETDTWSKFSFHLYFLLSIIIVDIMIDINKELYEFMLVIYWLVQLLRFRILYKKKKEKIIITIILLNFYLDLVKLKNVPFDSKFSSSLLNLIKGSIGDWKERLKARLRKTEKDIFNPGSSIDKRTLLDSQLPIHRHSFSSRHEMINNTSVRRK